MFGNCQLGGMNFGFPDVCKTPIAGAPVPLPYPNLTFGPTGLPPAVNVLYSGGPAHNISTTEDFSVGDNAGLELGLISELDMGPTLTLLPSLTVMHEGMPATKLTSMTGHNGVMPNAVGATLVPAQVTVLILS